MDRAAGLDETVSFDEDEKRRANTRRAYTALSACILHAKHFLINPRNMQFRATGAARGSAGASNGNGIPIRVCILYGRTRK